jgi:hypothetical protein
LAKTLFPNVFGTLQGITFNEDVKGGTPIKGGRLAFREVVEVPLSD